MTQAASVNNRPTECDSSPSVLLVAPAGKQARLSHAVNRERANIKAILKKNKPKVYLIYNLLIDTE